MRCNLDLFYILERINIAQLLIRKGRSKIMGEAGGLISLIGEILGIIFAIEMAGLGELATLFKLTGGKTLVNWGTWGIVLSLIAIILGAVAMKVKSKAIGTWLIIISIFGFFLAGAPVSIFMILPFVGGF